MRSRTVKLPTGPPHHVLATLVPACADATQFGASLSVQSGCVDVVVSVSSAA
jgi:hypothetical protein